MRLPYERTWWMKIGLGFYHSCTYSWWLHLQSTSLKLSIGIRYSHALKRHKTYTCIHNVVPSLSSLEFSINPAFDFLISTHQATYFIWKCNEWVIHTIRVGCYGHHRSFLLLLLCNHSHKVLHRFAILSSVCLTSSKFDLADLHRSDTHGQQLDRFLKIYGPIFQQIRLNLR